MSVVVPVELVTDVGKEGFTIVGAMEKPELGWRMAIAAKGIADCEEACGGFCIEYCIRCCGGN